MTSGESGREERGRAHVQRQEGRRAGGIRGPTCTGILVCVSVYLRVSVHVRVLRGREECTSVSLENIKS